MILSKPAWLPGLVPRMTNARTAYLLGDLLGLLHLFTGQRFLKAAEKRVATHTSILKSGSIAHPEITFCQRLPTAHLFNMVTDRF